MVRKLTDNEFREIAIAEIAEWNQDFSEENIKTETERHKIQDKWL